MYIKSFSIAALLPLLLASPIPQDATTFSEPSVSSLPGVNITNGRVASTGDVVKNSYIIVLKDNIPSAQVDQFENKVNKRIGRGLKNKFRLSPTEGGKKAFNAVQVTTDKNGLADIAKDPSVAFVELDAFATAGPMAPKPAPAAGASSSSTQSNTGAAAIVQRPGGAEQWGLGRISHKKAGQTKYVYDNSACSGTRIYVLDTGIRTSHEQFQGATKGSRRAFNGANFIQNEPFTDENGHGTHCAATAAGWTTGVCRSATVINVKVLGKDGRGAYSGIIAGMQWAANDAKSKKATAKSVLSISLGGGYSEAVNAAVQSVIDSGVTVVVAAGNSNANAINTSPASAPNAITVGATDSTDNRAWFSNFGSSITVFAPGVNIYSAWYQNDKDYAILDGTSQATPHVAGLAAYLMTREKIGGAMVLKDRIITRSGKNYVKDPQGSNNRIAYNNSGQ